MSRAPYISVVAASRNDDHGGDPLRRTQIFLNAFAHQCRKFQVSGEIVLVEWNPPADRPSLRQALDLRQANEFCQIRFVTVPRELHRCFAHWEELDLFQMIAKNVGIRRARGDFIVATNIDILFSDELMAYISTRKLDPEKMYRVDRIDVDDKLPSNIPVEEQLRFCFENPIRAYRIDCCVDRAATVEWLERKRRREPAADPRLEPYLLPSRCHPRDLHLNACGDFALLHREKWEAMRGYPEFDVFAMHIDSLFCCQAHYAGVRMAVLPYPCLVFHIEHSMGSGWTPEGEKVLFDRLSRRGIRCLEYDEAAQLFELMRRNPMPVVFNGPSWGFGNYPEHFEEDRLCINPLPHGGSRGAVPPTMGFDKIRADYLSKAYMELRSNVFKVPQVWASRTLDRWMRSFKKRLGSIRPNCYD